VTRIKIQIGKFETGFGSAFSLPDVGSAISLPDV